VDVVILLRNLLASFTFLFGVSLLGTPTGAPSQQNSANAPASPPLARPDPNYHLPFGQTYVYAAEWRIFNAGTATLRVERAGQEARVVGTADAAGSVAALYHVHDTFEAFLDPTTMCSRNISKHAEEGLRRVDTNITFDYQHNKSVLEQKNLVKKDSRHEEHDISGCVTDVVSAIYYAGTFPLQPGKTYSFPLNNGGATVTVDLHVEAREQIKTPAGTFYAVRVRPEASSGLLKDKGQIWIWFSDDAAHVPLQMRGHMFWGSLALTLQRIDHK
jgi:ribosomal protein S17E